MCRHVEFRLWTWGWLISFGEAIFGLNWLRVFLTSLRGDWRTSRWRSCGSFRLGAGWCCIRSMWTWRLSFRAGWASKSTRASHASQSTPASGAQACIAMWSCGLWPHTNFESSNGNLERCPTNQLLFGHWAWPIWEKLSGNMRIRQPSTRLIPWEASTPKEISVRQLQRSTLRDYARR